MTTERLGNTVRGILPRLAFVLASTAIVIVFSEKYFWYVTGFGFADLLLGYFFPTAVFLMLVEAFRIRHLAPLFLAAAVFGFLTEGVLVGTIYEGGPLGLFNLSYTPLAWHAPLSIVFGWYALRRWLVEGKTRALVIACSGIGLLWGLWTLAWWLPENVADPQLLAQGAQLGQWPLWQFAAHAFLFTAVVMVAHWLFGRGVWLAHFRPTWPEKFVVAGGLLFFFGFVVLPQIPWAPLKLGVALAAALLPLFVYRRRQPEGSLLADLTGPVQARHALILLIMPAVAVAVYALAAAGNLSTDIIHLITAFGLVLGPAIGGAIAFALAIVFTLRRLSGSGDDRQVQAE